MPADSKQDWSESLQHWLRQEIRRHPRAHRAAKEVLVGLKLLRYKAQRVGSVDIHSWGDRVGTYPVPFAGTTPDALRAAMTEHGLRWNEGRHTIYLPPQPGREAILGPELVGAFPPQTGFKILKNFERPGEASYLHEVDARGEAALVGPLGNLLFAAAALHAHGLGPRPYDIAHLVGASADLTAIITEHVEGQEPSLDEHEAFIRELLELERRELFQFANPSRTDCGDFAAPDCNNNLISSADGPRYVDPQVLLFDPEKVVQDLLSSGEEVLHFGDVMTVVNAGDRFLYQEVPGAANNARRGTAQRWATFDELLRRHRAHLDGRFVFDVCCNSGMMMHGCLMRGAHWAFGWDLPAVAGVADRLLPLLGTGRSQVFGTSLGPDTRLVDDLPDWVREQAPERGGVALFLAAWHHVDFPPGVGDLPWEWLIYEGRENETKAVTQANFETMAERWGARLVEATSVHDGISQRRPLALLRRVAT